MFLNFIIVNLLIIPTCVQKVRLVRVTQCAVCTPKSKIICFDFAFWSLFCAYLELFLWHYIHLHGTWRIYNVWEIALNRHNSKMRYRNTWLRTQMYVRDVRVELLEFSQRIVCLRFILVFPTSCLTIWVVCVLSCCCLVRDDSPNSEPFTLCTCYDQRWTIT